jgi:hypothetical protein
MIFLYSLADWFFARRMLITLDCCSIKLVANEGSWEKRSSIYHTSIGIGRGTWTKKIENSN